MNKEQMEVLNVMQQVLKGVTTTLLALNPEAIPRVARGLQGFAAAPGIEPLAKEILANLAQGVALIEAAGRPKQ